MIPGIDPRVDYAFKRVFGSEPNISVLRSLTEAVLKPPPGEGLVELHLRNPFNDKEYPSDKLSVLDIKARDQLGRQYNIEMEMAGLRVYPQRVLYYWSVLHGEQLRDGEDYAKLQATISIGFVNAVLFPAVPDYHLHFQLREAVYPGLIFSPHLSIHLVELPKFKLAVEELKEPLDLWSYFLIHGGELDNDNLPEPLRGSPVQQAMEVLSMMAQSESERERYQARLKAERDHRARIQESLETGMEKGRAEGELIGRIHLCQRLLRTVPTPNEELLGRSVDDLRILAAKLESQLGLVN